MKKEGERHKKREEKERGGEGKEGARREEGEEYESVCKQKFIALVPMQEQSHYQDREQQRLDRFGGRSRVGSSA